MSGLHFPISPLSSLNVTLSTLNSFLLKLFFGFPFTTNESLSTIPHEILGKYGGGLVLMKPASLGTGVIAGGAMRAVMESAGIKDVLAKSKGSSNPHNVVKATFDGLIRLRDPLAIAKQRGVSLKKVFNG